MANYKYSQSEKVDMLLIYGECLKNATQSEILYAQRYPDRLHHPTRSYFAKVEEKFRREPEVNEEKFVISEDVEIDVVAYVEINPTASTREIAFERGISHQSVWKILSKHGFKSYKYQVNQHLYEADGARRITFCNWFLQNYGEDINFHKKILFSDESRFTNNGMFNRNNNRYWSRQNPHLIREGNFQERFGINVWMGVLGNHIIGPIFFEGPLTAVRYRGFLENEIEGFIDEIPLAGLEQMYFQQDGAPPHSARIVAEFLNNRHGNRWIGTNGPVRWPARSPDLSPLDFHYWAFMKNEVYATPVATIEELRNRIEGSVARIQRQQLNNVLGAFVRRIRLCLEVNGQHFEQLL